MSKWKPYKLGDFITHKKGFAFKSELYQEKGCPIIRVSNFTGNSISLNDILFIAEEQKANFKEVEIRENDIIIATVGSWPNNPASIVGRVIKAPKVADGALLNQNAVIIYPNKKLEKHFLYYLLKEKNFSNYLVSGAQGSANQASIKLEQIYSYEFTAPKDIVEQSQIAQILTSLDDKIELNQQMNQTLEATAQAIFKEWFVNFNFPGFDGELINGLPKGWRMGKLGEVVRFIKGVSYRSSELIPSKFALVTLKSINRFGGLNYSGFKEFYGTFKQSQELIEGDVIIAQTDITQAADVVGCPAIVENPFGYEKLIASIDIVKCILINSYFSKTVLYYFLNDKSFKDYCLSHTNGSTVLHLRSSALPNFKFPIPNNEVLKHFTEIINPIREKIISNNKQIQSLAQIRDSLLPKLMSGKIEIKN